MNERTYTEWLDWIEKRRADIEAPDYKCNCYPCLAREIFSALQRTDRAAIRARKEKP